MVTVESHSVNSSKTNLYFILFCVELFPMKMSIGNKVTSSLEDTPPMKEEEKRFRHVEEGTWSARKTCSSL